jgi:hypothetical protein
MDLSMSVYSQFNTMPTNPRALEVVTSTQNWTPRATGWVNFVVVGGGGGGTGGYTLYDYNGTVSSSSTGRGGGAGGLAIKSVYVTRGQSYTITIGAGGAGQTNGNTAATGGSTSVVGPGISLIVTGGSGANKNVASTGGTVPNLNNATYDFYAQGGGSNSYGGGAVALYGNTAFATSNGGQGAGAGSSSGYGFPAALGANATTKVPGISSEGTVINTYSAATVAANCGGAGAPVTGPGTNTYAVATAYPCGAFAGGSQGTQNGGLYQYGAQTVGVGGTPGTGGGGGAGYAYTATAWQTYQASAAGVGVAGGAGCVIVEYL